MAVTSCTICTDDWTARGNALYEDSVSVSWRIETNSEYDGPARVKLGAHSALPHPLPHAGYAYAVGNDSVPNLFAQEWTLSPTFPSGSHGKSWKFTWTYSPLGRHEPGDFIENPLLRPVKWESESLEFDTPANYEVGSLRAITNLAGIEYNPPAIATKSERVVLATVNIATLAQVFAVEQTLMGSNGLGGRNDAEWQGFPAGQVLALAPRVGPITSANGFTYYPVTFRFRIRTKAEANRKTPDGDDVNDNKWTLDLLEQGNVVLSAPAGIGARLVPESTTQQGVYLTPPFFLADDGTLLPEGGTPIVTAWDIYEDVDFAGTLGF